MRKEERGRKLTQNPCQRPSRLCITQHITHHFPVHAPLPFFSVLMPHHRKPRLTWIPALPSTPFDVTLTHRCSSWTHHNNPKTPTELQEGHLTQRRRRALNPRPPLTTREEIPRQASAERAVTSSPKERQSIRMLTSATLH